MTETQKLSHLCHHGEVRQICEWVYEQCTTYCMRRLSRDKAATVAVSMGDAICRTLHAEKLKGLRNAESYLHRSVQNAFSDYMVKQINSNQQESEATTNAQFATN